MNEPSRSIPADEGLWAFSLRTYRVPGVAERCLKLQDRDGADVNLVLFAAWAGSRRPALDEETLCAAIETAERWSELVVRPLRQVRRAMKGSELSNGKRFEALREQVKGAELEGERQLQAALEPLVDDGEPPRHRAVTVAAGNALRLLRLQEIELREETLEDLRAVLLAAYQAKPHLLGELVASPVVVTADEAGREGETMRRLDAHLPPSVRHTAVSVVVVSESGRWLLQRRVEEKCAFGSFWANSCCTHPLPGEAPIETARRRAREELGLEIDRVEPAGAFAYTATDALTGFVESEYDHVFVARVAGEPEPTIDPNEIAETAWLEPTEAVARADEPDAAPWYRSVAELAAKATHLAE